MTGGTCSIARTSSWGRLGAGIISQLIALLLFSATVYAQIIPANRVTSWVPGVTYNGGIPSRTTIYKTLSPSGGDDTAAIQAALSGCPANQVVLLTAGVFKISGSGLSFVSPNCTLRGAVLRLHRRPQPAFDIEQGAREARP